MYRRLAYTIIIVFILVLGLSNAAFAELSVGVKKGDWIEYQVSYTGSPTAGHDINWARMEMLDVQGTNITVKITSRYSNGTTENITSNLNLETGQLIDDFIIPANLKSGQTFYDENLGNVTISKAEQHQYAGVTRTVLYASASQNTYVWDQATGISVEGTAQGTDYYMHTVAVDTNMWQPSAGFNDAVVLVVVSVLIVAVLIVLGVLFHRRRSAKQRGKSVP
jgi:hypothetical protein